MKLRRHPYDDALLKWLEGYGPAEVDAHVATCERCANTLERLDGTTDDGDSADDGRVAEALASVFQPPVDLTEKLQARVAARISSNELVDIATDLFAAGVETTRLLFTEE